MEIVNLGFEGGEACVDGAKVVVAAGVEDVSDVLEYCKLFSQRTTLLRKVSGDCASDPVKVPGSVSSVLGGCVSVRMKYASRS